MTPIAISPATRPARWRAIVSELADERSPLKQKLSPRQSDVLELLVAGFDPHEIAAELQIDHVTVRKHVQRLSHRLNFDVRRELLGMTIDAITQGLIRCEGNGSLQAKIRKLCRACSLR